MHVTYCIHQSINVGVVSLSIPRFKVHGPFLTIFEININCAQTPKSSYIFLVCIQHVYFNYYITSLIPRLSWGSRKESLVMTACTCANPYQQNMVSCFSLEKDIVNDWRWCLEDINKVTQTYVTKYKMISNSKIL